MQPVLKSDPPDDGLTGAILSRCADGSVECALTLEIDRPPDNVWRALTEAERLPHWLAPGIIEPRLAGAVRIDFEVSGAAIDSAVTAWAPGERLAYSWSSHGQPLRPVDWRLTPTGAGTVLSLSLTSPAGEDAARAFAGWCAHLQMLGAYLAGAPVSFPAAHFKAVREAFGARLAASD